MIATITVPDDVAIVRVEELYPFPEGPLRDALAPYPAATEVVWVQEEPENMGGWPFLALNLPESLAQHGETRQLRVIARPSSASPAAGTAKKHAAEQAALTMIASSTRRLKEIT